MLIASASTSLMLAGCATFSNEPPPVPQELRTCFDTTVGAPAGEGALTSGQIFQLISDLKRSELEKSACGKRLLRFIDGA